MAHRILYFVQCAEKPVRGDSRSKQQKAKGVPPKHMPPGRVWALDAHLQSLGFPFFRDPRHPHQREDEQRRDAEEVGFPVRHHLAVKDIF